MMAKLFWRSGLLLLGVGLAATVGAFPQTRLTGVVTQLQGNVELAGPGVPRPPLASLWQVLRDGVKLTVPEHGAVGIVCSTYRFVRLRGPVQWLLSRNACAGGRQVSPASYHLVASDSGRFKVVAGLQNLDLGTRRAETGDLRAPLLLSPRNTAIRTLKPTVSWLPTPSAIKYRVEWRGSVNYDDQLPAERVACASEFEGRKVCILPWPDHAGLPQGQRFYLKVSAQEELTGPWRTLQDQVEVLTLTEAQTADVENRLREPSDLGLEGLPLEVARAGVLATSGLYWEAAEGYRKVLAMKSPEIGPLPAAELRVTLADLNATMGLFEFAEPNYRQALQDDRPSVQAAASYGLGRVEYTRHLYREAAQDFKQACQIYSSPPLAEEQAEDKEAACGALEKAQARLPR